MRKIKVLHVVYSFGIGGMEKGVAMLINHASAEFEHEILCLTCSGDSRYLIPAEIPVYEMHKGLGNSLGFIWQLSRKIKQIGPDVVHTRNWGGLDAIIAARLAGVGAVVHGEHGWGMEDRDGMSRKRIFIRRALSYLVREFVAVSRQIQCWLKEVVAVQAPVSQIYNGLPIEGYMEREGGLALRRELEIPESAPIIGIVGRLDPIKDHVGLLAAFEKVREEFPESRLLVVGDGSEMSTLTRLAGEGVLLLGMRSDVPRILNALDVYVLNSLNEGISNTILEAMATGLPVVATAVGGTPELIKDHVNGLLVPPRNPDKLARAMMRYLGDSKLRHRHGLENCRIIAQNFSIQSMLNGYESVWKRVVRR